MVVSIVHLCEKVTFLLLLLLLLLLLFFSGRATLVLHLPWRGRELQVRV